MDPKEAVARDARGRRIAKPERPTTRDGIARDARGRRIEKPAPPTTLGLAAASAIWLTGFAYSLCLILIPSKPTDDWEPLLMTPELRIIGSMLAAICLWKAIRGLSRLKDHLKTR